MSVFVTVIGIQWCEAVKFDRGK